MQRVMAIITWVGAAFISAIFVDSLRFKFTGHPTPEHIFTTLRDWSGIGLFYPAGPWIIGLAELAASVLLIGLPVVLLLLKRPHLVALSQFGGALIALGVMSGAITFHLFTPLGIETPTEWADGAPIAFSPALFIAACASWVFAVIIPIWRRPAVMSAARGR